MKLRVVFMCAAAIVLAVHVQAATYTLLDVGPGTPNPTPIWNSGAIWDLGTYPGAADDEAIISNTCVHGPSGVGLAITLTTPVTVGVIRTVGFTTNLPWPAVQSGGNTMFLRRSDGLALIEGAGFNAGSWQMNINANLRLLSDLEVRGVSNKSLYVGSQSVNLSGASNLYLRNRTTDPFNLGLFGGPSPDFTGETRVYGPVMFGNDNNHVYIITNSVVYAEPGSLLQIHSAVSNVGKRLVMRGGSSIKTWWINRLALRTPVELHGVVSNRPDSSVFYTFFGDISGTGRLVHAMANIAGRTNRYVGSLSPGLNGPGTIMFYSVLATGGTNAFGSALVLGDASDTLLLNIEQGDQIIVTNSDTVVDLSVLDVYFLNATGGTTNWFLQSVDGFKGGAFNSVTFATGLTGYIVSNVPGMAQYIGAVVVPEPAVVLAGLLGLLAARLRR